MSIKIDVTLVGGQPDDGLHPLIFFKSTDWPEHEDLEAAMKWLDDNFLADNAENLGVSVEVRIRRGNTIINDWMKL